MVDKARSPGDVARYAEEYADFLREVDATTSKHVQMILKECLAALLRRINVPEDKVKEFAEQVHERRLPDMFGMLQPYDWQETRRIAMEEGRDEEREKTLTQFKKLYQNHATRSIAASSLYEMYGEEEAQKIITKWRNERPEIVIDLDKGKGSERSM